jgi:hypothetical protein
MVIKTIGKINFDPKHLIKKHKDKSTWKKTVTVEIQDDICAYYAWFIKKRFNLNLILPVRGPHITIINDRESEINNWDIVKEKYNKTKISVNLELTPQTNGEHWWLKVPFEDRGSLNVIREELTLGKPYFGYHLTIGLTNPKEILHSLYIKSLIENNFLNEYR